MEPRTGKLQLPTTCGREPQTHGEANRLTAASEDVPVPATESGQKEIHVVEVLRRSSADGILRVQGSLTRKRCYRLY